RSPVNCGPPTTPRRISRAKCWRARKRICSPASVTSSGTPRLNRCRCGANGRLAAFRNVTIRQQHQRDVNTLIPRRLNLSWEAALGPRQHARARGQPAAPVLQSPSPRPPGATMKPPLVTPILAAAALALQRCDRVPTAVPQPGRPSFITHGTVHGAGLPAVVLLVMDVNGTPAFRCSATLL